MYIYIYICIYISEHIRCTPSAHHRSQHKHKHKHKHTRCINTYNSDLQLKLSKILYDWQLSMASFRFCGTYLLHISPFVVNKSAISPFLGGMYAHLKCSYIYTDMFGCLFTQMHTICTPAFDYVYTHHHSHMYVRCLSPVYVCYMYTHHHSHMHSCIHMWVMVINI